MSERTDQMTRILEAILRVWRQSPSLRLGQLLSNCMTDPLIDLQEITDDDLEDALRRYFQQTALYGG